MTVDPQVRSPDGRTYDVVFVGTTAGRILKIVNTADPNDGPHGRGGGGGGRSRKRNGEDGGDDGDDSSPTLVEEMVAFRSDVTVESLRVVRNSMEAAPRLVALTRGAAVSLPLSRCGAVDACAACVALRDPYCAWDSARARCVDTHGRARMDTAALAQSVETGVHRKCRRRQQQEDQEEGPEEPSHSSVLLGKEGEKEGDGGDGGDGVGVGVGDDNRVPSNNLNLPSFVADVSRYTSEELSMAVATSCVCALVVGFITGFLLARRCSCSREGENPYHVPYLNQ